jgi:hypothetical protein
MTRRQRGFETEELLAERWQQTLFPNAKANERGRPGLDVRNTGHLLVEVKARGNVSIVAQLKKLRAARGAQFDVPVLVWRHNGQGPASMDEWTVHLFLNDFERLYEWGPGK